MDSFSDDHIRTVTVQKSARVGYTKMITAFVGYCAEHSRRSVLIVQPTEDDAKGFAKDELNPMIRDVPVLSECFSADGKTNDPDNTLLKKKFRGGTIDIIGAHSPRGFRRLTKDVVLYDETDGFEMTAGNEGDQFSLGDKRMMSSPFPKSIRGSTPTVKGASKIENSMSDADMVFRYHINCPHCDHPQFLKFGNLIYPEGDPLAAAYRCDECAALIEYTEQRSLVDNGFWMSEDGIWIDDDFRFFDLDDQEVEKPEHIGWILWAGYSPFPNASFGRICKEHRDSSKDPTKLRAFVNTVLGELWDTLEGEGLEAGDLENRRENYDSDTIPEQVLLITAGVDVQDDRLEIQVIGYGVGLERWVLDYVIEYGDPSTEDIWNTLDEILAKKYLHPSGLEISIEATGIDTGGHHTQSVYSYCKKRIRKKVLALKGMAGERRPIWDNKPRKGWSKGLNGWIVGVDSAKDRIYHHLQIEDPGAGFIHFPETLSSEYFKQLTAETVVTRFRRGHPVREWHKPSGRRNEALDTFVYCEAARESLNVNMKRRAEKMAEAVKESLKSSGSSSVKKTPAKGKRKKRSIKDIAEGMNNE